MPLFYIIGCYILIVENLKKKWMHGALSYFLHNDIYWIFTHFQPPKFHPLLMSFFISASKRAKYLGEEKAEKYSASCCGFLLFYFFFLCSPHKRKLWITVLYLSCYSKIIFIYPKLIMIWWFQNCFSHFRGKTIVLLNCLYSAKPLFRSLRLVIIFTAYKTFRFVKRVFALSYASPSFMYIVFFLNKWIKKEHSHTSGLYTFFK